MPGREAWPCVGCWSLTRMKRMSVAEMTIAQHRTLHPNWVQEGLSLWEGNGDTITVAQDRMSEVVEMKRNPQREEHSNSSPRARLHMLTGTSTWQHMASRTAVRGLSCIQRDVK